MVRPRFTLRAEAGGAWKQGPPERAELGGERGRRLRRGVVAGSSESWSRAREVRVTAGAGGLCGDPRS